VATCERSVETGVNRRRYIERGPSWMPAGLIARYHCDACVVDSGKRALDGHTRLSTRAATAATRCSSRSLVFCRLVFQLLTTIDGTDGTNAMVATFTDDTYDRGEYTIRPALSISSLPKGCDVYDDRDCFNAGTLIERYHCTVVVRSGVLTVVSTRVWIKIFMKCIQRG